MALICPVYFNFSFIILFSVWKASEVTSFGPDWEMMMQKKSHRWGQMQSLSAYTRCLLPALFMTALPSSTSWPKVRVILEEICEHGILLGSTGIGCSAVCFVVLWCRSLRQALNTLPNPGEGVKYPHQLKYQSQKPHGAVCSLLGIETFCKVSARNAPILLSWTLRTL